MWWVYILQSQTSKRFYTGCTADLERRVREHQEGQSPSTRNRGPWELVYQKALPDKAAALARSVAQRVSAGQGSDPVPSPNPARWRIAHPTS